MNLSDIDLKSLIIGSAISTAIVILASNGYDWLYPFSAIGLLYVGYKGKNIIMGTLLGAIGAIPMVILGVSYNAFGNISTATFDLQTMQIFITIAILLVGGIIGFVGALAHKNRDKAKIEYEKKNKK